MGAEEIRAYLSYLATDRKIAASTQNIALSALLFLYSQVFRVDLPNIENIERARQTWHLPVVLTREEIKTLLSHIEGIEHFDNFLLCCESSRLERISDEGVIDFNRSFHRYFWGESYRSCFHPIISDRQSAAIDKSIRLLITLKLRNHNTGTSTDARARSAA